MPTRWSVSGSSIRGAKRALGYAHGAPGRMRTCASHTPQVEFNIVLSHYHIRQCRPKLASDLSNLDPVFTQLRREPRERLHRVNAKPGVRLDKSSVVLHIHRTPISKHEISSIQRVGSYEFQCGGWVGD